MPPSTRTLLLLATVPLLAFQCVPSPLARASIENPREVEGAAAANLCRAKSSILEEHSKGLKLPDGFVAHSTYWLVTDSEILGVSNLRHSLTPALRKEGGNIGYGIRPTARGQGYGSELLRRTLQRAKELGLAKVLLTCGKVNLASVKVILANGGVLESEEFVAKRNEVVQRYWTDLVQPNPSIQSGRPDFRR